ncbi:immune inhibitor A domain-containing protein [Demequina litorisediminis]|uniref:Peptidase M6-like domain-containing protein n=1 Tax=Demequina litorisediminis TaxID=1849022 RepID=A0ABQ6IFK0_9MICO|nr:hypothetical protein GCM10025876_28590 [Demequina litorisediminis]
MVLAEFGDTPSPTGTAEDAQRSEGPLHNEIPQPNRKVDNSTVWQADYNQEHYQDLYFDGDESLRDYYETQSSGRYSVDGEVTDWVKVGYTQGAYGNDACGSNVCSDVWDLVKDAANVWYQDQAGPGPLGGRGERRPRVVRRLGPLRLRRRWRLQRARRLHRPFPDCSRGR